MIAKLIWLMLDEIPKKERAITTLRLAPVFIPSIPGSAIGFLVTDCINTPLMARLEPAKIAKIVLGILLYIIDLIKSSFVLPIPKAAKKSLILISFVPSFNDKNIVIRRPRQITKIMPRFICFYFAFLHAFPKRFRYSSIV